MGVCLFIYSFVGHYLRDPITQISTTQAGGIMNLLTCLFIAAFAMTWGPLVWAIVGELYPARDRALCMALATASNWLFNFLISFFSKMITDNINYFYGLVFGECCFVLFFIGYSFIIETKDRPLKDITKMYVLDRNPITSRKCTPESLQNDGVVDTHRLHMVAGSGSSSKAEQAESKRGGVPVA